MMETVKTDTAIKNTGIKEGHNMTYKQIVIGIVEKTAEEFVTDVLSAAGIKFRWTRSHIQDLSYDRETAGYLWGVHVTVALPDITTRTVSVGGTADDILGVVPSCILDGKGNTLWMASEKTREHLGIKRFKLPAA